MRRVAKIAISLPLDILEAVERRQVERGETRSQVIAELLATALRREREQSDVDRYVRGYLEQPETGEDIATLDRLAVEAAKRDPWP
jgi:metal-responsive CopG/Arc/MetJ family transcriptional regulator